MSVLPLRTDFNHTGSPDSSGRILQPAAYFWSILPSCWAPTRESCSSTVRIERHYDPKDRIIFQDWGTYDEAGNRLDDLSTTTLWFPDGQPGVEGRGPGGADNCGWNPMNGCTKRSVKIWDAMVQPGAHQDTGGSAARPSLGQEAVTNTGDGTFDSGVSGGGGGNGRPNPCLTAGDCGGPIGDAGGGAGPAN